MTADTIGGVWTYCMDLCQSLNAFNTEIHLVTMGERMKDWQRKEVDRLKHVTVYETSYWLEWMENPWEDVERCSDYLLQLEEKLQPDLIHLNCYSYGSLPFKAPVIVVAHSDVWSWFMAVKGSEPPPEWSRYHQYVKEGLHGADVVIAPSKAKLQMVENIYDLQGGAVIYNGRNASLFSSGEKESFVFSMGRIWDEAKNVKLLTEAVPFINAPVRIAGDNNFDRNSFVTTGNNVEFPGKLSTQQVAEQLAKAAVYVLPAKYEPFGLSALEAALSGCALVLGDIPTLREIWQDAAIYVDTDDVKALVDAVNNIIEDEEKRKLLSNKAKARAENFSAGDMAEKYCHTYRLMVTQNVKQKERETV